MGLRWPGQGGGRGAPPGFPGTSQSPDADPTPDRVDTPENDPEPIGSGHSMARPGARSSAHDEEEVEEAPAPRALFAPTSPLRTGEPPARRPRRHATAGRASRFLSSRWPGVWTGAPPTSVPSGYRRSASPDPDLDPGTDDGDVSSDAVVPTRPTRARSHVKVHRAPDSGEEATVTPLPSLRERRSAGSGATRGAARTSRSDTDTDTDSDPGADHGPDTGSGTVAVGGPGVVRRVTGPFQTVVGAVYAALADPLVNAPPEVREKRAAQVRRVGIAAAGTLVACVLVYAIFPVQTYLDLRSSTQRAEEQREALRRANDELERRQAELNEAETVEEIAREDYGMVLPGEESYGVLPAPESTTTSSTTTTAPG
jgi:cell division protein FtsB